MSRIRERRDIGDRKGPVFGEEKSGRREWRIKNSILLFDGKVSFLFLSLRFPFLTPNSLKVSIFIHLSPIHSEKKPEILFGISVFSPFSPA